MFNITIRETNWKAEIIPNEMKDWDKVEYYIEANHFEKDTLFEKYSRFVKWEWGKDFWITIAEYESEYKITLQFSRVKLDNHLVIFYHPSGMFLEWNYIYIWLKHNFPNSKGKCDSGNFLKCLKALNLYKIEEEEKKYILSMGIGKNTIEYTGNVSIRILKYNGFPLKFFSSVNQLAEIILNQPAMSVSSYFNKKEMDSKTKELKG